MKYLPKKSKVILFVIMVIFFQGIVIGISTSAQKKQPGSPDVLLVYSSGIPFTTISEMNPDRLMQ